MSFKGPASSLQLQVLGHGRQAHLEGLGELGHRGLALDQPRQDGPAGRVGEGGEGVAEAVGGHQD
jgi:hypothetical protein